jgi:hypothetical protein
LLTLSRNPASTHSSQKLLMPCRHLLLLLASALLAASLLLLLLG